MATRHEQTPVQPVSVDVFVRRSSGLVREISTSHALIGNILLFNLVIAAVTIVTVPFTFPGANLPVAVLLGLIPSLLLATVYFLYGVAMPRSGGDYVYISRTLHPSLGFAANFSYVAWGAIFSGITANWISTIFLPGFFAAMGWSGLAKDVAKTGSVYLIGIGLLLVIAALVIVGLRPALRIMKILFYAGMVGLFVMIVAVALTSHHDFAAAVNKQGSYQGILGAAHKAGYVSPKSWNQFTPTLLSVGLISLVSLFVQYSAYVGGEMKQVRRSVPIALYGTAIIGSILFLIMAMVAVHSWHSDFLAASNYLSENAPKDYPLDAPPSFTFFAGLPYSSPVLLFLINVAPVLLTLANFVWGYLTYSRCLFAWSFDRLLPRSVASVDERTHSPVVAVAVLALANIGGLIWYTTGGSVRFLGGATLGVITTFLTVSVAATLFPYLRSTVYREAPLRPSIGRVPIISLVGALSFACLGAMVYAFLTNDTFGANVSEGLAFFVGLWVAGFGGYWAVRAFRLRQGVPFDTAFAELPPE
jgi:amino acid transporter